MLLSDLIHIGPIYPKFHNFFQRNLFVYESEAIYNKEIELRLTELLTACLTITCIISHLIVIICMEVRQRYQTGSIIDYLRLPVELKS